MRTEEAILENPYFENNFIENEPDGKKQWEIDLDRKIRNDWIIWSITMAVFIFCLLFFSNRQFNKIEQEEAEKIRQIELKYGIENWK